MSARESFLTRALVAVAFLVIPYVSCIHTDPIEPIGEPVAVIDAEPTSVLLGAEVRFSGIRSYWRRGTGCEGSQYNWKFGDGESSLDINPVHTYMEPGTFETSLEFGCVRTDTAYVTISVVN